MKKKSQKDKTIDLFEKIEKGERLTLSERGQYEEIFGKGKKPKVDLPNWMKKKKKTKKTLKVEKYG